MYMLVDAMKKWEEYQTIRKARLYANQKEKEEREKLIAEAKKEAYQKGLAEGKRIASGK